MLSPTPPTDVASGRLAVGLTQLASSGSIDSAQRQLCKGLVGIFSSVATLKLWRSIEGPTPLHIRWIPWCSPPPPGRSTHHCWVAPTRPSKVEATTTAPSATFRPRAGNGRGAGPPITSAPFLGSNTEAWQEQTNALRSLDHMLTGHPW